MVERHVYVKLKDEWATPAVRKEIVERAREAFPQFPGVTAVRVGSPADAHAESAWDVAFTVSFDRVEDVPGYRESPGHVAFVDEVLKPRMAVLKAWNFEY